MKKVKVSEATGIVLDWMVAKCEGKFIKAATPVIMVMDEGKEYSYSYQPTKDWAQGGPIIEREKLDLCTTPDNTKWRCVNHAINHPPLYYGSTPLIAAMRCYVASKLGDEVEVPDEIFA